MIRVGGVVSLAQLRFHTAIRVGEGAVPVKDPPMYRFAPEDASARTALLLTPLPSACHDKDAPTFPHRATRFAVKAVPFALVKLPPTWSAEPLPSSNTVNDDANVPLAPPRPLPKALQLPETSLATYFVGEVKLPAAYSANPVPSLKTASALTVGFELLAPASLAPTMPHEGEVVLPFHEETWAALLLLD